MGEEKVRTLAQAARFVDRVGVAYVFPDNRIPLPALWGAVCGNPFREMEREDWGWTKAVGVTWDLKDRLGERRLAYFGRAVRGKGTLISLRLLSAFRACRRSDAPLSSKAQEALNRLGNVGPMSTYRLRESLRLYDRKGRARFEKLMRELYGRLMIANVGADDSETRWASAVVDTVDHAFPNSNRPVRDPEGAVERWLRIHAPAVTRRHLRTLLGR